MKIGPAALLAALLFVLADAVPQYYDGESPYNDGGESMTDSDYGDNALGDILSIGLPGQKRSCVRRNGNCDYRPNDCCFSSSCRCNLWGTNCRCQRVGLFQKWG